jgi:hypothetical protein
VAVVGDAVEVKEVRQGDETEEGGKEALKEGGAEGEDGLHSCRELPQHEAIESSGDGEGPRFHACEEVASDLGGLENIVLPDDQARLLGFALVFHLARKRGREGEKKGGREGGREGGDRGRGQREGEHERRG